MASLILLATMTSNDKQSGNWKRWLLGFAVTGAAVGGVLAYIHFRNKKKAEEERDDLAMFPADGFVRLRNSQSDVPNDSHYLRWFFAQPDGILTTKDILLDCRGGPLDMQTRIELMRLSDSSGVQFRRKLARAPGADPVDSFLRVQPDGTVDASDSAADQSTSFRVQKAELGWQLQNISSSRWLAVNEGGGCFTVTDSKSATAFVIDVFAGGLVF